MIRVGAAIAVAVAIALVAPAAAAPPSLRPLDEAAREPGFFTFRARLQAAIAARDTAALLAAVDPAIKNSFGGDDGAGEFRTNWKLGDPASPLWHERGTVLALGGRFQGGDTFLAPYVYAAWPGAYDAFEHVAIVGRGVRARTAPSADAPWTTTLDFAILRLAPPPIAPDEWLHVRLPGGRTGWVAKSYARSPIAHRAIFHRSGATWRLAAFVAGD